MCWNYWLIKNQSELRIPQMLNYGVRLTGINDSPYVSQLVSSNLLLLNILVTLYSIIILAEISLALFFF